MMEYFTQKKEKTIIIVYDEEVKEYTEYLKTLFSCFKDIKCISYRIKEYQSNEVTITSRENILFLGDSKEIKKYYNFMDPNVIFKYGMRYGNKGTRHFMYVEKDVTSIKKEYKNFIESSKKVDEELKKREEVYFSEESIFDNKILKGIAWIVGGDVLVAGKFFYDWYEDKKNQEKIREQQYLCLCRIACKKIIQKLEEEGKYE